MLLAIAPVLSVACARDAKETRADDAAVGGDRPFSSTHPVMRRIQPRVGAIEVWFR